MKRTSRILLFTVLFLLLSLVSFAGITTFRPGGSGVLKPLGDCTSGLLGDACYFQSSWKWCNPETVEQWNYVIKRECLPTGSGTSYQERFNPILAAKIVKRQILVTDAVISIITSIIGTLSLYYIISRRSRASKMIKRAP